MQLNPLATQAQCEIETTALRLLQRKDVLQAKNKARKILLADPLAQSSAGRDTLEQVLAEAAQSLLYDIILRDVNQPRIGLTANAAHSWFGHTVKGARYGLDNPDSIYCYTVLDPAGRYKITATPANGKAPTQISFLMYANFRAGAVVPDTEPDVGESASGVTNDAFANGLFDHQINMNSDGSFSLTLSCEPANEGKNHIQFDAFSSTLFIRQAIPSWHTQAPYALTIERLDPYEKKSQTDDNFARQFIKRLDNHVFFWAKAAYYYMFQTPVNTLPTPASRGGDWGYATLGNFALEQDEALIVTIDPKSAAYTGFVLADPWMLSPEHITQSGSLNNTQSYANADGSFTYVIAHQDPGINNWLDTGGLQSGGLMIRWQAFNQHPESGNDLVKSVQMVKLSALPKAVPATIPRVSSQQREQILAERAAAFNRRTAY
jgi:hypothetical protein